jgi:hypothetical protein
MQMGAVVKSYMRKGFLIYEENMHKYLVSRRRLCKFGGTSKKIKNQARRLFKPIFLYM